MTDPDGYQLVEKEFNFKGHTYSFLEDLGDNWHIYRQSRDKLVISFELVHLERQEQYEIAGNVIPKKWNYPSAAHWGTRGFTYKTLKECYQKFDRLPAHIPQAVKEAKTAFQIPKNKEFTVKDLAVELGLPYANIYAKVKEVQDRLTVVRTIKNKTGRDTKVYKYD